MGVVDVDVRISSHLKEELAWAIDKWLRVISNYNVIKNSDSTKVLKGTKEESRFKFKTMLYALLCGS